MIVLGGPIGPIGVHDTDDFPFLNREIKLLERRLARDSPTLGICLGAQLMACALGEAVYPCFAKEIVLLASTKVSQNQAFANGKHGLGLQFHLEADPAGLEHWFVGHTVELASAGISVPHLRAATAGVAKDAREVAEAAFGRWLTEIG